MTEIIEALEVYTEAWFDREQAHTKLIETRLLLEDVEMRWKMAVNKVNAAHFTLEKLAKELVEGAKP